MKKLLSILCIAVLIAACIVPVVSQAKGYGTTMYINNPDTRLPVPIRADTSSKATVLKQMKHGSAIRFLYNVDKKWAAVELIKGSDVGYIPRKYLSKNKPTTEPAVWNRYDSISTREVNSMVPLDEDEQYIAYAKTRPGGKLPVRKGPAKNFSILVNMSSGDEVLVLAEGNTWSRVQNVETGDIGYTMTSWLIK